jgi:hypothetical protein
LIEHASRSSLLRPCAAQVLAQANRPSGTPSRLVLCLLPAQIPATYLLPSKISPPPGRFADSVQPCALLAPPLIPCARVSSSCSRTFKKVSLGLGTAVARAKLLVPAVCPWFLSCPVCALDPPVQGRCSHAPPIPSRFLWILLSQITSPTKILLCLARASTPRVRLVLPSATCTLDHPAKHPMAKLLLSASPSNSTLQCSDTT